MQRSGLPKSSRLKSKKDIEALFQSGEAFFVHPYRVMAIFSGCDDGSFAIQYGFSAPKKKFKTAVQRNRIKRITREACRLQQQGLVEHLRTQKRQVKLMFIYAASTIEPYPLCFTAVAKIFKKLAAKHVD
ncbi:MAG: hypothetical protein RL660_1566 [Bacteroidota bacterium]|jgi:ribonuclease P protein component